MRTSGFNDVNETSGTSLSEAFGQNNTATGSGAISYIYNPFLSTSPTFFSMQGSFMSGTEMRTYRYQGVQTAFTVNTGFQFFVDSGTVDEGNIEVFGVREI